MVLEVMTSDGDVFDLEDEVFTKMDIFRPIIEVKSVSSDNLIYSSNNPFTQESMAFYPSDQLTPSEDDAQPIELKVNSLIMNMIVEWCHLHINCPEKEDNSFPADLERSRLGPRDIQYFNTYEQFVFDIMVAADYLKIDDLVKACALKVALEIRGKSVEELQAKFL
ncbi:hypothetical protein Aperf_G00000106372 [Anoplocephala perfoliata]